MEVFSTEENEEALKWLHKEEGELAFYLDKDGYNLTNIARMLNSYAFHKNSKSKIKPSEPLSPPKCYKDTSTP